MQKREKIWNCLDVERIYNGDDGDKLTERFTTLGKEIKNWKKIGWRQQKQDVEIEKTFFPRAAKSIHGIGHVSIKMMKRMVFDSRF